ncbi:hypothetical protein K32_39340 [Kaistia sp. 32K]|nr:hypothetical protein K32_39340 [Kaistia sp. 32K]
MDMEADNAVEHGLVRDIDRHVVAKAIEDRRKRFDAFLVEQQRDGLVAGRLHQGMQHDFALGDEVIVATDEVAFANIAIRRDAGVGGVGDGNEKRQELDEGWGGLFVWSRFLDANRSPLRSKTL